MLVGGASAGGQSSRVVEAFPPERVFSWNSRAGRDITVLIRDPTRDVMRRISFRCKESEGVALLLKK